MLCSSIWKGRAYLPRSCYALWKMLLPALRLQGHPYQACCSQVRSACTWIVYPAALIQSVAWSEIEPQDRCSLHHKGSLSLRAYSLLLLYWAPRHQRPRLELKSFTLQPFSRLSLNHMSPIFSILSCLGIRSFEYVEVYPAAERPKVSPQTMTISIARNLFISF